MLNMHTMCSVFVKESNFETCIILAKLRYFKLLGNFKLSSHMHPRGQEVTS